METNIKSVKAPAMRLSADFSNIMEFAYFVGGSIQEKGAHPDGKPAVIVDDGNYFHGGYYAMDVGGRIQKWYPRDFEALFEVNKETIEMLPEGWDPYDGVDLRAVFGTRIPMSKETFEECAHATIHAHHSSFLTIQRNTKKLMDVPLVNIFKDMLNDDLTVQDIVAIMNDELTLPSGVKASIVMSPDGEPLFASHYTGKRRGVQELLNRLHYKLEISRKNNPHLHP